MLTKVNDVIFQYLWRYSCQFKPQKFSIDFFDVHLCPPLWKRFRHLCSRHHWRMPLHPCTISSLQHWISCSCLFHMHWVNIQDDRWQVHSRAPPCYDIAWEQPLRCVLGVFSVGLVGKRWCKAQQQKCCRRWPTTQHTTAEHRGAHCKQGRPYWAANL